MDEAHDLGESRNIVCSKSPTSGGNERGSSPCSVHRTGDNLVVTSGRTCQRDCRGVTGPALAMAFQPIVDIIGKTVFAYEALVRGPNGESAASVLASLTPESLYKFDQACRVTAIEKAVSLGIGARGAGLAVNFLPNAIYEPFACMRATLATATRVGFPVDRLIFEITETEAVVHPDHLTRIIAAYQAMGFRTAIDDFGAGQSNLVRLAHFIPDIVKLDMQLIRGVDNDARRQTLLRHCIALCRDLDIVVVAEGVETHAEYRTVASLGIHLIQGYFLCPPRLNILPTPTIPP